MTAPLLEKPLAAAAVLYHYLNGETVQSSFGPHLISLGFSHLAGAALSAMERFTAMVSFDFDIAQNKLLLQGVTRAHLPQILSNLRSDMSDEERSQFDDDLRNSEKNQEYFSHSISI